jgi:hypothetical protein
VGQVLHGSATTTTAIRRAIQHSQESLRTLARRHGINPKTVAKWRKRSSVTDLPIGPKHPKSTVLTIEKEAMVIAFSACVPDPRFPRPRPFAPLTPPPVAQLCSSVSSLFQSLTRSSRTTIWRRAPTINSISNLARV